MSWLRALSLVLILGSLAVSAEIENVLEEVPRVRSDQDNWLLINPLNFLYTKTTTTPKPQSPQYPYPHYPQYPYYHYYPPYPHYPHVPHYPNYTPYSPHPTQPTPPSTPPTKPTRPSTRPSRPSKKPSRKPSRRPPTNPPLTPYYPISLPFKPPHNGYYPWIFPTPIDRQPLIFFISPSGSVTTNLDGNNKNNNNKGNKDQKDRGKDDKTGTDGGKNDKTKPAGGEVDKSGTAGDKVDKSGTADKGKVAGNRMDSRFFLRTPFYPYTETAKMDDTFYIPEAVDDDEHADFDDESAAAGRNIQSTGIYNVAESEGDNDTLMVDGHTDPTTVPLNKTISEQEALIYVKNFKQGRKLEAAAEK